MHPPIPTDTRLGYIDSLKAFAIFLVVAGHVNTWGGVTYSSPIHHFIYAFHMPLFFLLSGYLAYRKTFAWREMPRLLLKKSRTLLLPFFLVGLLYAVCFQHSEGRSITPNLLSEFLSAYWNYGYWFLIVLFLFFLIYYAALSAKSLTRLASKYDLLLYLAMWMGIYWLTFRSGIDFSGFTSVYLLPVNLPFFLLGILLRQYGALEKFVCTPLAEGINFLCFGGVLYLLQNRFAIDDLHWLVKILFAVPPVLFFYALFRNIGESLRFRRAWSYIGQRSLDIYLFHFFFLIGISHRVFFQNPGNLATALICVVGFSAFVTGCALTVSTVVRSNPWLSGAFLGMSFPKTRRAEQQGGGSRPSI